MLEYTQQCNPSVISELKNMNWNRMHGTSEDLAAFYSFIECVDPRDIADILIGQNKAFVSTVLNAIYAKNKLDYPPIGPMDQIKQRFQSLKIREILKAMLLKQELNERQYDFGALESR